MSQYTTAAKRVTIVLHGLMVAKFAGTSRYEVGILRCAPGHIFDFWVSDGSFGGSSGDFLQTEIYNFEIIGTSHHVTSNEDGGGGFNRNAPIKFPAVAKDHRFAINMNQLHEDEDLSIAANSLGPFFYIQTGKVFSKNLTVLLDKTRGNSPTPTPTPYGRAAQVVGIEIDLQPDEVLVLRSSSGNEIWTCRYHNSNKIEALVTNLPTGFQPPHVPTTEPYKPPRLPQHSMHGDTHFAHYYTCVFTGIDPTRRVEFCLRPDILTEEDGDFEPESIPTYVCELVTIN